eukprot:Pgem_evm1s827
MITDGLVSERILTGCGPTCGDSNIKCIPTISAQQPSCSRVVQKKPKQSFLLALTGGVTG